MPHRNGGEARVCLTGHSSPTEPSVLHFPSASATMLSRGCLDFWWMLWSVCEAKNTDRLAHPQENPPSKTQV